MSLNGDTLSIALAGLSGQGLIMFTKVLMASFKDDPQRTIRTYEVLGTAHRGTMIFTHMRISTDPEVSFIIAPGEADILVGCEPLEALRVGSFYLKDGGTVIFNNRKIVPVYASVGKDFFSDEPRPKGYLPLEEIEDYFKKYGCSVVDFNATKMAIDVGHYATMNMVMLGATLGTGMVPVELSKVEEKINELVPPGTAEMNIRALHQGLKTYQELSAN